MAYKKFLIFYLFVCAIDLSLAIIYACNQTADCGCSKTNAHMAKIVGGEDAFPFSWGWAASLQEPLEEHFCTGAIVSPLHIITAAHCVTDAEKIDATNVVVGINRLSDLKKETAQVRSVRAVFPHPGYDKSSAVHDIAVLRLNQSLNISTETILARLCLPRIEPSGKETDYPADAVSLVAIGWGRVTPDAFSIPYNLYLQQVTLKAVSVHDETCAEFVTNSNFQFCAGVSGGGKDTCQGDSGGPLMRFEPVLKRWLLAGVTSVGLGCGDPRYSGVYTRASAYRDWLRSIVYDGFFEASVNLNSAATANYYSIYFGFLSVAQLFFYFALK